MFEPGNLLYFNPFIFPDGGDPKPKFFVVLGEVDETVLLASLPTSKDHIPSDVEVTSGCLEIPERMVNAFTFLANEVVTDNGFFFEKNTFIYGQNIKTYNTIAFSEQEKAGETEIELKGKLKADLFTALKDCLRNSDAVRKRFKQYL
ncbi:MAG: hypothetical protein IJK50_03795 [Prevotella sp.]|nr:hypothetical protein [Prevotella sp.]